MLRQALDLLRRPAGPVLEDFPYDCSEQEAAPALPACPVDFSARSGTLGDTEQLLRRFESEFNSMHTWYSMALERNRRTAVGVSGLSFDQILTLYRDFIVNDQAQPGGETDLADRLRLATDDLKSCYYEALRVQPNQPTDAASLANWFWGETHAAAVINEVRKRCLNCRSKAMLLAGELLLIPRNQMHRFSGR